MIPPVWKASGGITATKPFNYRASSVWRSSLAWGLLGLFFFIIWTAGSALQWDLYSGRIVRSDGSCPYYSISVTFWCIRMRLGVPEGGEDEECEETVGRLKVY